MISGEDLVMVQIYPRELAGDLPHAFNGDKPEVENGDTSNIPDKPRYA